MAEKRHRSCMDSFLEVEERQGHEPYSVCFRVQGEPPPLTSALT